MDVRNSVSFSSHSELGKGIVPCSGDDDKPTPKYQRENYRNGETASKKGRIDCSEQATAFNLTSTFSGQNSFKTKAGLRNDSLEKRRNDKRRRLSHGISVPCYNLGVSSDSDNSGEEASSGGVTSREVFPVKNTPSKRTLFEFHSPNIGSTHQIPAANPISSEQARTPAPIPLELESCSQVSITNSTDGNEITLRIPSSEFATLAHGDRSKQLMALGKAVTAFVSSYLDTPDVVEVSKAHPMDQWKSDSSLEASGSETDEDCDDSDIPDSRGSTRSMVPASTFNELVASDNVEAITQYAIVSATDGMSSTSGDVPSELVNTYLDWQPPSPMRDCFQLSLGSLQLDELLLANREWDNYNHLPDLRPLKCSSAEGFSATDFFDMIHNGLHVITRQYLRLASVKNLPTNDRVILLRAGASELLIIRTLMKFDAKTNRIQIQTPGCESIDINFSLVVGGHMPDAWKRLISAYPTKWRTNERVMLLLSVIMLLNPQRPMLQDKATVEEDRIMYTRLLKDYLASTYGDAGGGLALESLITQMDQLPRWVKQYADQARFEINPDTMKPVSIEINIASP